jgi:putative NADH-flavin reductase
LSEIKSVVIAGERISKLLRKANNLHFHKASGSLGPHVVKAFLDANFQVTVLTQSKMPGVYDASVSIVEVDFASVESLTAALKDIGGLVSTVATTGMENQTILIDAAVAAGVKRFISSEYGSVTTNPKVATLPIYAPMFKIKQYLHEKAMTREMTWTVLACSSFLEFLFGTSMLLDFANHKATLFDKGNDRISSASLPNMGKAIVGIMQNF